MGIATDAIGITTGMSQRDGRREMASADIMRKVGDIAQAVDDPRLCAQCGATIVRRRKTAKQNPALCAGCDQRERRAAYFRSYYAEHKDRILTKNRRWARDNKDKIVQLRQARRSREIDETNQERRCLDCGISVTRAERCRRCYIRFRYATDSSYRERRLATTRRWLDKRQNSRQIKEMALDRAAVRPQAARRQ